MRLLVCTQVVDRADPVLGFFHTWIEGIAAHAQLVEVVCLKKGEYDLPQHVRVHSLGKEKGRVSRLCYAARFVMLVWRLRHHYDAVFVHMNEEYVLLGGLLWRLWGTRVVLWRNHKIGSLSTRVAAAFADTVCHTSPEAYVAGYPHAKRMPIGIDTKLFTPAPLPAPQGSILFFGRLDPVKKPEVFLEAMKKIESERPEARANVYGDPTSGHEHYAAELKKRFAGLSNVRFESGVPHAETPAIYRAHAVYVNLTPSGSFDKTIGEAMASGCIVISGNAAVKDVIGPRLFVESVANAAEVARALAEALALSEAERAERSERGRRFVEENHSLAQTINTIAAVCLPA